MPAVLTAGVCFFKMWRKPASARKKELQQLDQTACASRRFVKDVHVTFAIYSSALCPLIGN